METIASMHIPEQMGSVCDVDQNPTIFRIAPALADNSLLAPAVQNQPPRSPVPNLKQRRLMLSRILREPRIRRKEKVCLKAKVVSL